MKFHTGKWIIGGVIFGLIMWAVNGIMGWLAQGLYAGPAWRMLNVPAYWFWVFVANIVGGLLFALMYAFLYKSLAFRSGAGRGAFFGFIVFLGTSLYGMTITYMFMSIKLLVIMSWILGSFISYIIGGLVLGAIYNPKNEKR